MKGSCTMQERVEQYVSARRKLGYQMSVEGRELLRFARFADELDYRGPLSTEIALKWARAAHDCSSLYQARRLEVVRCLARYLSAIEPGTEIPPKGLLGSAHRRTQPHIYRPQEIAALMKAAATLDPKDGLRPMSYGTLIGLMACTGLRLCEALRLDCGDVDSKGDLLSIRQSKFRKSRLVPLHPSASRMLYRYATFRDRYICNPRCSRFLVSERGTALKPSVVHWTFSGLRRIAGVASSEGRREPRLYDLRHTFACRRLLQWYGEGRDVNQCINWLSTYLGHARVTDTYWYLSGVPELMSLAADRFERFAAREAGGRS